MATITITKIVTVEGDKGPYPEIDIAGEKYPKKVFSKDAQDGLDGVGVYEVWYEEKPNPKYPKYPFQNVISLKKVVSYHLFLDALSLCLFLSPVRLALLGPVLHQGLTIIGRCLMR